MELFRFNHACFSCRTTFKRESSSAGENRQCPKCGGIEYFMGKKFRAPKKEDEAQWKVLKLLAESGVWHKIWLGNAKKTPFPETVLQAKKYIREFVEQEEEWNRIGARKKQAMNKAIKKKV